MSVGALSGACGGVNDMGGSGIRFLQELVRQRRTGVTSFRIQFEKKGH